MFTHIYCFIGNNFRPALISDGISKAQLNQCLEQTSVILVNYSVTFLYLSGVDKFSCYCLGKLTVVLDDWFEFSSLVYVEFDSVLFIS